MAGTVPYQDVIKFLISRAHLCTVRLSVDELFMSGYESVSQSNCLTVCSSVFSLFVSHSLFQCQ